MNKKFGLLKMPIHFIGLAISVFLSAAQAAPVSLADAPILAINPVKPNLMFTLDNSGSMAWESVTGTDAKEEYQNGARNRRAFFSSAYNQIYYNPAIRYRPPVNADGTSFGASNPSAARLDGFPTSGGTTATVNLKATCFAASLPVVPTFNPGNYPDTTSTTATLNCANAKSSGRPTLVARYAFYYNWRISGAKPDGSSGQEGTAYYARQDILPLDSSGNPALYPPLDGESRASARTDCVSTSKCTYSEEIQNFANWFSYYRSRISMTKSAIGFAFVNIDPITVPPNNPKYRVGFGTINDASGVNNSVSNSAYWMNIGDFDQTQKNAFYSKIYAINPSDSTPLRSIMNKIGLMYQKKLSGAADPVQYSCQRNFHILSTDGFWNDSSVGFGGIPETNPDGASSGNKYASREYGTIDVLNGQNTLADVAMYYYKTDLRTPTLSNCNGAISGINVCENNVKVSEGDKDKNIAQHVTTFTIGLGVDGKKPYIADYETSPDTNSFFYRLKAGLDNWPNPTSGDNPEAIDDLWHAAVNGFGSYLNAKNPVVLAEGLTAMLGKIGEESGAGSGAAFNSPVITSDPTLDGAPVNNRFYKVGYTTGIWTGNVSEHIINSFNAVGPPTITDGWNANEKITNQIAKIGHQNRLVMTMSGGKGIPFVWTDLSPAQKIALGKEEIVNYLRGDRTKELNGEYRKRMYLLGDIIGSEAVVVEKPRDPYNDAANPGYSAFKDKYKTRPRRLYVGANDGMLHVLDAKTGEETWAYVPSHIIRSGVDGIAALANLPNSSPPFNHRFYVDKTPVVNDADLGRAGNPLGTTNWRTLLVGGLNKGGRGYYALDVTEANVDKTSAAANVLWEFDGTSKLGDSVGVTQAEVGYSFGTPLITKTRAFGWVVLVSSGYNNADGQGYLFVLNAKTGQLLHKFRTGVGTPDTPSGFAQFSGYNIDHGDFTVEQVYGSDLLGNVWRFDLSASKKENLPTTATRVFQSLPGQPITVAPKIAIDESSLTKDRWIFVGTGRYLDVGDRVSDQVQSMYAFKDGTKHAPSTVDLPIKISALKKVTGLGVETAITKERGWYEDHPSGELIHIDPRVNAGIAAWATRRPTSDLCARSNAQGIVYARSINSGYTRLTRLEQDEEVLTAFTVHKEAAIVKLQFVQRPEDRKVTIFATDELGGVTEIRGKFGPNENVIRMNWKEIIDALE